MGVEALRTNGAGRAPVNQVNSRVGIFYPPPFSFILRTHGNVYLHMASTYVGVKEVHVIYTKVLEDRGKVRDRCGATTATKEEEEHAAREAAACVGNDKR